MLRKMILCWAYIDGPPPTLVLRYHSRKQGEQTLGRMRIEDDAVAQADHYLFGLGHIPGAICAEEKCHLLAAALGVHHVGVRARHLTIVPVNLGHSCLRAAAGLSFAL